MSAPRKAVHARRSIAISIFHDMEKWKNRSMAERNTRAIRPIKPIQHSITSALHRNLYTARRTFITPPK
jgi:hypothetical protein